MFSSYDQMNFKPTSRKDDLHSLCYMLLYLLNDLRLPGLDIGSMSELAREDTKFMFITIRNHKKDYSI